MIFDDAMHYYLQDIDDNPPNRTGDCEQCGAVHVEIEYSQVLDVWRCVESFPCEIVAELEAVEIENEQAEPELVEMLA